VALAQYHSNKKKEAEGELLSLQFFWEEVKEEIIYNKVK